jgi:transposase-like protein
MIGVRTDGTKELLAVEDGYRESTDSWATVLRDLKRRGLRALVVAVGDSALGFWAAVGALWPETREQRCWVHRLANVLDKPPKRLQPKAKQALHAIMNAPTRAEAEAGGTKANSGTRPTFGQTNVFPDGDSFERSPSAALGSPGASSAFSASLRSPRW